MANTIGDLLPGTVVLLEENSVLQRYILMYKDDVSAIILRDVSCGIRRMHSSDVSNYENCEMDTWLSNESTGFLSLFSEDVRDCFVSRSISIHNYGDTETYTIPRKCFLLSEKEVLNSGSPADGDRIYIIPLLQAKNTIDANTARICRDNGNTAVNWWTRSPRSATAFCIVGNTGMGATHGATMNNGVRPALSVSLDTSIKYEGSDFIILSPEPGRIYKKIDVKVNAGTTPHRPKKARVIVDASGLSNVSVKICNNYKDENPVWYDATGGNEISINNSSKTSENWEIGVWLYGEGVGQFNEPLVITEED